MRAIVKVASGCDAESLEEISKTYELVVKAGVHRASSIKVATRTRRRVRNITSPSGSPGAHWYGHDVGLRWHYQDEAAEDCTAIIDYDCRYDG